MLVLRLGYWCLGRGIGVEILMLVLRQRYGG